MTSLSTITFDVDVSEFKKDFKSMLPKSRQRRFKEEELDALIQSLDPSEHVESYISSMKLALRAIDKTSCRASTREYSNAVRYNNLVAVPGVTQREAYLTVFPDKRGHWDISNPSAPTKKTQSNSVQQYHNSAIVRAVDKELALCVSSIYSTQRMAALDSLLKKGLDERRDDKGRPLVSAKVQVEALKVFLDNVKPSEENKGNSISVEINTGQATLSDIKEVLDDRSVSMYKEFGNDNKGLMDELNKPLNLKGAADESV